jgi:hypothetical protein
VVDVTVAMELCEKERYSQESHNWDCSQSLFDLKRYLIFEEFGVLEVGLVENKDVADGCECRIEKCTR